MNMTILVLLLVVVVAIAFGIWISAQRRRNNPMRSLEELERQGGLGRPEANQDEILRLLTTKQKIAAIKRYREMTGVGLREAKAAVEQMERELLMGSQSVIGAQPFTGVAGDIVDLEESAAALFLAEIQQLLLAGNKIAAIKLYREKTGASLREAKDAIERMVG
jgi:ribosomal protein L7/L12